MQWKFYVKLFCFFIFGITKGTTRQIGAVVQLEQWSSLELVHYAPYICGVRFKIRLVYRGAQGLQVVKCWHVMRTKL